VPTNDKVKSINAKIIACLYNYYSIT